MDQSNVKDGNFGVTIFLILLAGVILFFSVKQNIDFKKNKEELTKQISHEVSQNIKNGIIDEQVYDGSKFPDFNVIKGGNPDPKIKSIKLSSDCLDNGCVNDQPATVDFDGLERQYVISGEFARAYLYIDALVDYSRPLTSWDDIYFTLNWVGGHLISDEAKLPTPPSDSSRYLYNLNSISYYPKIEDKEMKRNKIQSGNLFTILQKNKLLNAHVSVSSNRPGRVIKEASIYYECLAGSDCSIVEKPKE